MIYEPSRAALLALALTACGRAAESAPPPGPTLEWRFVDEYAGSTCIPNLRNTKLAYQLVPGGPFQTTTPLPGRGRPCTLEDWKKLGSPTNPGHPPLGGCSEEGAAIFVVSRMGDDLVVYMNYPEAPEWIEVARVKLPPNPRLVELPVQSIG